MTHMQLSLLGSTFDIRFFWCHSYIISYYILEYLIVSISGASLRCSGSHLKTLQSGLKGKDSNFSMGSFTIYIYIKRRAFKMEPSDAILISRPAVAQLNLPILDNIQNTCCVRGVVHHSLHLLKWNLWERCYSAKAFSRTKKIHLKSTRCSNPCDKKECPCTLENYITTNLYIV